MMVTKTKTGKTIFTRESLADWIKVVASVLLIEGDGGQSCPRFYLPVRKEPNSLHIEFWIFPLAPIAWFCFLVKGILWSIWKDMVDWLGMIEWKNRLIKKRKEVKK